MKAKYIKPGMIVEHEDRGPLKVLDVWFESNGNILLDCVVAEYENYFLEWVCHQDEDVSVLLPS